MHSRVDVAVIGAGFAGLSTAYALTKSSNLSVLILEQEKKLGGHASGRNAGMIRQALSDPYLVRLAKEGREALRKASAGGWSKIRFKAHGSLLLAKGRQISDLRKTRGALLKDGVASRWLSREASQKRVAVLAGTDFKKALYCPSDAMVDIEGLLSEFVTRLKRQGARISSGVKIRSISKKDGYFEIRTQKETFYAKKIVNAAGAWAGLVGRKAGAAPILFKAYRRHLFFRGPGQGLQKKLAFCVGLKP